MKQKLFRFFSPVILLLILLFGLSFSVSADSSWRTDGEAVCSGTSCVLTTGDTYKAVGGFYRDAAIDARNGVTVSFSYQVGNGSSKNYSGTIYCGFRLIFADIPLSSDTSYGDGTIMGNNQYLKTSGYYALQFDSSKNLITAQKSSGKALSQIAKASATICDGSWHTVTLTISGGFLTVYRDNTMIMQNVAFDIPDLCYIGFSASTNSNSGEKHTVADVSISGASDAVLVYFDGCGGTCSETSCYLLPYSSSSLPTCTRSGYTFDGWYTKASGGIQVSDTNYSFQSGQTLYAHWKMCKVTFKPQKGKVSTKTKSVSYGTKIGKLPTPTRKGYAFLGWYTKKSGGKKLKSSTIIKKDTTCYAHWVSKKKKVTIKLNKNGGKVSKSSITTTYGGKIGKLPTPTRSGYKFLGWYTKKSGGTKVKSSTKTSTIYPAKTLYAHWKKKSSGSSSSSGSDSSSYTRSGTTCPRCSGTGSITCTNCDGTGYKTTYGGSVPNYSGHSLPTTFSTTSTCYRCSGSGKRTCPLCDGSGVY